MLFFLIKFNSESRYVVLTFDPVGEILKCDHSNESYGAVLSRGTVH